ncbi:alpha,alpha-phosphotrehalase [Zooshikella ganghwensis]|uniref:alpha,alpha-phosphotrehalase n=1 Tax=Zooshikella ganghwensis TaxID=202772 RepID=UPI00041AE4EF|nr:alpha,alpha-phosphotrehalase [Zooshikella ganghwensis]
MTAAELSWWQTATIYQIYPKSFKDSGQQGTGDLQGIISKLDYLKKLGIDAIWLTPIYCSPQIDNGYDISDYYNIDPSYGSMEDFERLIEEAHTRNIKIIMDLVVNHTSTEHQWFKEAIRSETSPYHNYYIWRKGNAENPPNNWQSKFGGSAWEFVPHLDKYYLHLFAKEQADLNWENPNVRQEVQKVVEFWLKKGIDGFRLDVINLISKQQDFPNDAIGDGRRFYTDGPRVHEYLQELSKAVFIPWNAMTVGEMSSTTIEHCQQYSDPSNQELSMVFNFHHLKVDYPNGEKWSKAPFDFISLKKILADWQKGLAERGWNALFWCNHDQPRVVSRFGNTSTYFKQSAKMLATAIHGLRGTPYIYQGEEIGMCNPDYTTIDAYQDVETINYYQIMRDQGMDEGNIMSIIQAKSRDNSRTPMQWDNSQHAGFTKGTPWLKVADNYHELNAESALNDEDSVFYYYQQLIRLRKIEPLLTYGRFQLLLEKHPSLFAYIREYNSQALLVICNFYNQYVDFPLQETPLNTYHENVEVLLSNYSGTTNNLATLKLRPYEAVIFKLPTY